MWASSGAAIALPPRPGEGCYWTLFVLLRGTGGMIIPGAGINNDIWAVKAGSLHAGVFEEWLPG